MGGLIARVLSAIAIDRNSAKVVQVKADAGGGDVRQFDHYSAPGDDSKPLPSDSLASVRTRSSGRAAAVGYADTVNESKSAPGEKRIYARDTDGAVVVEVWLKGDGSVTLANSKGSVVLNADGSISLINESGAVTMDASGLIDLNGLTVDPSGNLATPGTIEGAGIKDTLLPPGVTLGTHTHAGGTVPAPDPGT